MAAPNSWSSCQRPEASRSGSTSAVLGPRARATITLDLDGRRVQRIVQDDGPGVPAEERGAIFQPGHRLSSQASAPAIAFPGAGLEPGALPPAGPDRRRRPDRSTESRQRTIHRHPAGGLVLPNSQRSSSEAPKRRRGVDQRGNSHCDPNEEVGRDANTPCHLCSAAAGPREVSLRGSGGRTGRSTGPSLNIPSLGRDSPARQR